MVDNRGIWHLPAEVRFWRRIELRGDCWIWVGARDQDGYGRMMDQKKQWTTHRWSYERSRGPVPAGLILDHLCRERPCANPDHLEPVTIGENTLRGETITAKNLTKTKCLKDHPLRAPNLVARKNGKRECRTCANETRRRLYRRNN